VHKLPHPESPRSGNGGRIAHDWRSLSHVRRECKYRVVIVPSIHRPFKNLPPGLKQPGLWERAGQAIGMIEREDADA